MMLMIVFYVIFRDDIVSYLYSIQADIIAAPLHRARAILYYLEGKHLDSFMRSRGNSWLSILGKSFDRYAFIFGGGRGFSHTDIYGEVSSLGLGGDNQYTVNIAELGIFGSSLLFLAIAGVYSFIHRSLRYLYLPYVLVYLLGGMACEIFQLSKSGQLFWLVSAYFIVKTENIKAHTMDYRERSETRGCSPA